MTCREMLMQEQPELVRPDHAGGCAGCPSDYGYLYDPDDDKCGGNINCTKCWDREIPGTLPMRYPIDVKAEAELANEPTSQWPKENPHISDSAKDAMKRLGEAAKAAVEGMKEGIAAAASSIKDSGDRTQFSTGAVRDMREGKGRCDLMPLEVVGNIMGDPIILNLKVFLNTMDSTYLYTCLNLFSRFYDDGKTKASAEKIIDQRYCSMFLEVAKHFEEGAKKYGENNWQKGIPVHCYIDSAIRHYLKWLRGDKDEPHDRAFVWNLMCCIWEIDYHKEDVEK